MAMTSDQYVQRQGLHCPFCESTDFSGGDFEVALTKATQKVECNECGGTWYDEYTLTGYSPDEDPQES